MKRVEMKRCILIGLIFFGWGSDLRAQEEEIEKGSFSATVNPSFYFLGGYSVKGLYHLQKRWSFGIASEGAFELPGFARDQFFSNDEDIDVNWDYLVGVEVRYRLNKSSFDKGFYVLGTLGYEEWTVEDDEETGEDSFGNAYASIGVGYNWYPFKKPKLHFGGSYNIIFILNNTDDRMVGNSIYNIRGVVPPSFAPVIYVGYRF